MSEHTPIEWCDSTVNPTENCDGCELWSPRRGIKICYAGRLTERRRGRGAFDEPIKLFPGRMAAAAKWSDLRGQMRADKAWIPPSMPRLIFISDMSDALSRDVEFQFLLDQIIRVVSTPPGNRHIWIWLTKRPGRMAKFSEWLESNWPEQTEGHWPRNLWALTSVTDERTARLRIPPLLRVGDETTVRGISHEPMFELALPPMLFRCSHCGRLSEFGDGPDQPDPTCLHCDPAHSCRYALDWIIAGGESGPGSENLSTPDRLRFLAARARWLKVPMFVKQVGSDSGLPGIEHPKGGDWMEWPEHLQIREFPFYE